ncbi:uncharacterized protein LOC101743642 isoform X1 [Bombyx mori]|uniref:Uncharacterized protein n=2 Tax=Bombyx TaxID=7090 RepID=A0A8R2AQX2_BOMMO|nr:uncharacterized protein LOC101743642 isoform X1 [Bombyx mori]
MSVDDPESRGSIMLKFLTHKLRTHSLNEENVSEKVEEHDSGTESDDEADRADSGDLNTDVIMKWNDGADISMTGEACACGPTPARLLPEPEPDHLYDHHSSEEELEVINGVPSSAPACPGATAESRRRGASSPPPTAPEKRKWSAHPYIDSDELTARAPSSDDDDTKVETPVRFRTSPPLEALKPRRAAAGCACAPDRAWEPPSPHPPPSPHSPHSPRRRRHRPALDFDKMQQLKMGGAGVSGVGSVGRMGSVGRVGGVRSWRAVGGAHAGELSVFCW